MSSPSAENTATNNWVVKEARVDLDQALALLQGYLEDRDDPTALTTCREILEKTGNVCAMVNMDAHARLAGDLVDLIDAHTQASEAKVEQILNALAESMLLLRTLLQIPQGLELQIRLIRQVNEIRTVLEQPLLSEGDLFNPAVDQGLAIFARSAGETLDSANLRKMRMLYQRSMLQLMRQGLSTALSDDLAKIFRLLLKRGGSTFVAAVSFASLALLEDLSSGGLLLSSAVTGQFRRVDEIFRKLIAGIDPEDSGLLKNILFYCVCSTKPSQATSRLIQAFKLEQVQEAALALQSGNIARIDPALARQLADALSADMQTAKDLLQDAMLGRIEFREALRQFETLVARIGDTLAMIGFTDSQDAAQEIARYSGGWSKFDDIGQVAEADMSRVADLLLRLESRLHAMASGSINADSGFAADTQSDIGDARKIILTHARASIERIKDSMSRYLASTMDNHQLLEAIAALQELEGGLAFYPLPKLASIAEAARAYIETNLRDASVMPAESEISLLADVIISIDYHLECLEQDASFQLEFLIDRATADLRTLGYVPGQERTAEPQKQAEEADTPDIGTDADAQAEPEVESAPEPALAPAPETAPEPAPEPVQSGDDEIIAIFIEEMDEVVPSAVRSLADWQNTRDSSALADLRRAFHTLKGGGRMIGASVIGELSWAFEELLNRVMAGTLGVSDSLFPLIADALELYPALAGKLANGAGQEESDEVALVRQRAKDLLDGRAQEQMADADDQIGAEETIAPPVDPVVLIYAGEAAEQRNRIVELMAAVDRDGNGSAPTDELVILFHTMAEGAHTAGLDDLAAEIQKPLDLCRYCKESSEKTPERTAALIGLWTGALDKVLEQLLAAGQCDLSALHGIGDQFGDLLDQEQRRRGGISATERERRFQPLHQMMERDLETLIHADQLFSDWRDGAHKPDSFDALHADLDKLAEVADQCGVAELAELSNLLREALDAVASRDTIDAQTRDTLRESYELLLAMLDAVASWQVVRPASADQVRGLIAIRDSNDAASAAAPDAPPRSVTAADSFQDELLQTFLEEADELLESITTTLSRWRVDRGNFAHADSMHRLLHTLKGGARVSGLSALGDASHEFESFTLDHQVSRKDDDDFFREADRRYDLLADLLEAVRHPNAAKAAPREEEVQAVEIMPVEETMLASPSLPDVEPETNTEAAAEPQVPPATETAVAANEPRRATKPARKPAADDGIGPVPPPRQDVVRLKASDLDDFIGLAGEAMVFRGRVQARITRLERALEELEKTIDRVQSLARRLDLETQAQIVFRREQIAESESQEDFDPLEMDRYSILQQLSRQLIESTSDLKDLRTSLGDNNSATGDLLTQAGRVQNELNERLQSTRMVPFSQVMPRFQRVTRQLSAELGKQVELISGSVEGELDRQVLDQIVPAIEHILRNAIDHGIEDPKVRTKSGKSETGRVNIDISRDGALVVVKIADDGAGLNLDRVRAQALKNNLITQAQSQALSEAQLADLIFLPGFSTAAKVTQISGRGVGMDVVRTTATQLGGTVEVGSRAGIGTTFYLKIPFTLSVNRALMVRIGSERYAVPLSGIEALARVRREDIDSYYDEAEKTLSYGSSQYRMAYLGEILGTQSRPLSAGLPERSVPLVLFRSGDHAIAAQIDEIFGNQQIVVKSLTSPFREMPGISGAAIMADGSVIVVLDMFTLMAGRGDLASRVEIPKEASAAPLTFAKKYILVVDDSVTVRKFTSRFLTRSGFAVGTAADGVDALRSIQETKPDLILLDLEMPRMDGFELIAILRASEDFKDIPVILVTSRTADKHRQRGLELGAQRYFGKPYQEAEILTAIEELTGQPAQEVDP